MTMLFNRRKLKLAMNYNSKLRLREIRYLQVGKIR